MSALLHGEVRWERTARSAPAARLRAMAGAVPVGIPGDGLGRLGAANGVSWSLSIQPMHGTSPLDAVATVGHIHVLADAVAVNTTSGMWNVRDSTSRHVADRYREEGEALLGSLTGEGVLAVVDDRRGRITLWRDALGVRPLYLHYQPGRVVVFSSDLRCLLAHPDVPRRLDLGYARAYVDDEQFLHPTRTLIRDVYKVPPGHLVHVDGHGLRRQRYWFPEAIDVERRSDADLSEELRELLHDAVTARLRDGDQVAAHLSGGLDSSSMAVLADRSLRARGDRLVGTHSWAPPQTVVPTFDGDERPLARAVAEASHLPLHFTTLTRGDVADFVYRDIARRPRATLDFEIATSRAVRRQGADVLVSGWGGDEFIAFNGRGYFAALAGRGRWGKLTHEIRAHARIMQTDPWRTLRSRVLVPWTPRSLMERRRATGTHTPTWLPPELRPGVAAHFRAQPALRRHELRELPGVRRTQLELLRYGHLSYRTESWASHGIDVGLRYTFPLLDRRVVEFALSLPPDAFFRHGWKRWLFREAMEGILPNEVRWNPEKFDNAAVRSLRTARSGMNQDYEEQLEARRDNPFVDVDHLLAAYRAWVASGSGARPQDGTGRALWLAFVDLEP